MTDAPVPEAAKLQDRLARAAELHVLGVGLMRANLRRANPAADEAEIERLLRVWLHDRPGAEGGDAQGHPRAQSSANR